ncbi:MAG TPA: thioesterase family protein [Solirubrobacteraceae bacterium]
MSGESLPANPGGATAEGAEGTTEVASVFVPGDDERHLFIPTEHARGPWDPRALHGGAPAALMTAALERIEPGAELPIARLSFEFLRPIPLAPLELSTRITRPGRRVQALEAELHAGGELVGRARALRILPVPEELPERAVELVREHVGTVLRGPDEGHEVRFALDDDERNSFAATAMQMRFLQGRPLKGGLPDEGEEPSRSHPLTGAATVWMRMRHPLLPGEPASPLALVPAVADFANGVSAVLPFDRFLFINADLDIVLDRRPQGEWIALEARTLLHPGGIGWSESVLHDARGRLGRARQALVVQPR